MTGYIYIALTILFTCYGQIVLKWRLNNLAIVMPENTLDKVLLLGQLVFDPYILSGLFAAFLASVSWIGAMTKFELSFAYPFMALNFAIVFMIGVFLFGEAVTSAKLIGMFFVLIGIVVIVRG
ncbi:MAG: hypothetical protein KTR16_02960 [Acidiferrobacterales bacterium]|nr:hypothetical protein [Acidiferrobacterales bacterium]